MSEVEACLARMDERLKHIEEAQTEQAKDLKDLRGIVNLGRGGLLLLGAGGAALAFGADIVKFLAGRG